MSKGIYAALVDESHVNRYFHTHRPAKVLGLAYLYPEEQYESVYEGVGLFYKDYSGKKHRRFLPRIGAISK